MEKISIHHLSLFLDEDIVLLKEEVPALASASESEKGQAYKVGIENSENPVDMVQEELELVYEGNFEKGILIVYEGSHLEPNLRTFLFKILQAVNCSLKDVALSASESVEEMPMSAIQRMEANKVLIFGKLRHELMNFKKHAYEIQNEEGVEYLFVDDIAGISENVNLKKSLWEQLQILFNIKK